MSAPLAHRTTRFAILFGVDADDRAIFQVAPITFDGGLGSKRLQDVRIAALRLDDIACC
jgi:hypothetical protein